MGVQETTTLKSISRTSEERETIKLKGNGGGIEAHGRIWGVETETGK